MSKVYFPNLNGLRFFAAILVVLHHVEQFKKILDLENNFELPFIENSGKIGVILFFVLSGYLITYLLLIEKKSEKSISITDFYKRRILRIWPLYFLIIAISFFVIPKINIFDLGTLSSNLSSDFSFKLFLFLFFLPNLALGLFTPVPYASQLWSIGYEEQFYLFWPWLVKKSSNLIYIFFFIIGIILFTKILCLFVFRDKLSEFNILQQVEYFYDFPMFDSLAIGGLFAYLVISKNKIIDYIFKVKFQVLLYATTLLLISFGIKIAVINNLVYSLLFAAIIVNLAVNKNTILNLENTTLNYFGKISYGIYMFHSIAIILVLKTLGKLEINNLVIEYILSIIITLILSAISYEFFEKYFIKLKVRYSKNKLN